MGQAHTVSFPEFCKISIHPLRGEWDVTVNRFAKLRTDFNPPTPWGVGLVAVIALAAIFDFNPPTPWGVGRRCAANSAPFVNISIHPLRGEWDRLHLLYRVRRLYFNPPTPWGVGLISEYNHLRDLVFQSTHSVGSGTARTFCCQATD